MSSQGANIPLVIQQSGDVSRVQESVQRLGEQQQAAAGADVAEQQKLEKSQVQSSEASDGQNRIKADDRRRRRREKEKKKKEKGRQAKPEDAAEAEGAGLLVDVRV